MTPFHLHRTLPALLAAVLLGAPPPGVLAQKGVIRSVAGTGTPGYSGDRGPATDGQLHVPSGVFVDGEGRIYVVDTSNHRVRRIDGGTITTLAGTGAQNSSGDGGPAGQASLSTPTAVFADGRGNTYVAEWFGNRIRRIDASGRIRTIAGTGIGGYNGDGLKATASTLWVPTALFVDGRGALTFAEWQNHRVRRIATDGTVSTLAGTGLPGFTGDGGPGQLARLTTPNGIFVDKSGRVYVSDLGNNRVRRIDLDGTITTIAGNGRSEFSGDGGPATQAALSSPSGLFVDDGGSLFITDTRNARIRKVDPSGIMTTVAGSGQPGYSGDGGAATAASLRSPAAVFVDRKGDLYIADASNNRIRVVTGAGAPTLLDAAKPKSADFDGDGSVGFPDFVLFVRQFGLTEGAEGFDPRFDLAEDGRIDFSDFIRLGRALFGR